MEQWIQDNLKNIEKKIIMENFNFVKNKIESLFE